MDLDPLSIVTPARVKVLLLPIGDHVRQSRFAGFVARLQHVNVVRLGDVSPDNRPHRTTFSPLAFPNGRVLYDLSTAFPPQSHINLAPFEIYREPLVVVGIADGGALPCNKGLDTPTAERFEAGFIQQSIRPEDTLKGLSSKLVELKKDFPKALVHQILLFDTEISELPQGIYQVLSPEKSRTTTVKTIMCDLTSRLLAEMTIYAKSIQALSSLDSPTISADSGAFNSAISAVPNHMGRIPRLSSAAESPRPFSPADDHPTPSHRVSMPAHLPSDNGTRSSTPEGRPPSPHGTRTPPTKANGTGISPAINSPPKGSIHGGSRTASQDRVSVNGSIGGSLGERERNKGKGRIGVVIGAMYLVSGLWPDALKELVQSAAIAKNSSDYIWHAKAMDYMLVCLLMCAWAGMDFHIPDILFPSSPLQTSAPSKSSSHSTSNSLSDFGTRKSLDPRTRAATLRSLTTLLPDLTTNILNLYSRAWTFTDDKLPPLSFCQSAIRFAKLLTAAHLSDEGLDDGVLARLVLNTDAPQHVSCKPAAANFISRTEIVNVLFRAYPPPMTESLLSITDHTAVLAGIIPVLSELGCNRKKALVLNDLTAGLLPALVQARKDGAAEMGMHPAASLASLNASVRIIPAERFAAAHNEPERGIRNLLAQVCQAYAITWEGSIIASSADDSLKYLGEEARSSNLEDSNLPARVSSRVLHQATAKAYGSQQLKVDVLRLCINICEALPDLEGALHYSAELLRIAGSGIAPGPESSDGSPGLPIDEQVRLSNNISRTLGAARHLGIESAEAEYWDDFLVRGIEIVQTSPSKSLIPHSKRELDIIDTIEIEKERNPFIYNPFVKKKSATGSDQVLVADEERLFRITLQNLYDFDIAIESISLKAEGTPFDCPPQSTLIGPYRTQTILLSGIPLGAGSLKICGCTAKIRGCCERTFPTFDKPWTLKTDIKSRHVQEFGKAHPDSTSSDPGKIKGYRGPKAPMATELVSQVISAQPNIVVKDISAPQSALTLFEGEVARFTVTLQNASRTVPVDLLLVLFDDSTAAWRQSALSSKELNAVDLYELELDSAHKQPFRWLRKENHMNKPIGPGEETHIEIEVLGRPGLSSGTVQVDYGFLGIPKPDIKDRFFTRQLLIPITVTVNPGINVLLTDCVALPGDQFGRSEYAQKLQSRNVVDEITIANIVADKPIRQDGIQTLIELMPLSTHASPQCLFLLDFHNTWSNAISIALVISKCTPHSQPFEYALSIGPRQSQRIPIPMPRIYLDNGHTPIPSLNPANKRQFVVSANSTPGAERALREAFWYREAFLKHVRSRWKEEVTGRTGDVELRPLRFDPRIVSCFKLEDLDIRLSVGSGQSDENIKRIASSTFVIPTKCYLNVVTKLHNRSSAPIQSLLRLQPMLANQPQTFPLDFSKMLLVNGVLQKTLPPLAPGETTDVKTGFLALSSGVYEWNAVVEELATPTKIDRGSGRARAATGELDVLGNMSRRSWIAEEKCIIVAMDKMDEVRKEDDPVSERNEHAQG